MIGRRTVPDAVATLRTEERREAWGLTPDGVALVATASALHVGTTVLPWTQVEKVSWVPPRLVLTEVAEVEGAGGIVPSRSRRKGLGLGGGVGRAVETPGPIEHARGV